ncbi:MAG TPA: gluconate 2-dehydrogenase subunit 3 family protein, partial [Ramlibacter sp.]|nr:gluconate 2-dehydrogenase subunit 3 family protein [Ramlibacter sp.]
ADASFTSARRETLRAVLAMLVPASPDGRMPGAAEMPQVLQRIEHLEAELPGLRGGLEMLEDEAIARYGAAFAALDGASRSTVLDEFGARHPAVLQRLALETVTCYYQQDGVIERLGMEPRPPYPKGYQVLPGDLTLLNPVTARGRIYRDAS